MANSLRQSRPESPCLKISQWRHKEGKGFAQGHPDTQNGVELRTSAPQASCSGTIALAVLSIDDLDPRILEACVDNGDSQVTALDPVHQSVLK